MPVFSSFSRMALGDRMLSFLYYSRYGHFCLLIFVGGAHFLWGLDAYGIMHNNEGLYAQIPREMLNRQDFVIPYLNGVPYIEKPPLLYWLIALVYKVSSPSAMSARLVPALAGFLTACSLYGLGHWQKKPLVGLWAALILMSSAAFILFSRMVYFEGLLTFFLSGALLCFYHGSLTYCRKLLAVSYCFLALAILTKGFVALILYGCVGLIWIMYHRAWDMVKWLFSPLPMLLFFLILLPWHILAAFKDPDFSWFYFINEHILRFIGQREPKDYYHGPFYYYAHRLLLYGLPWTFVVVLSLKSKPSLKLKPFSVQLFLTLWVTIFFLFFSFSQAKANYYIMTLLPPLAFLVADHLFKILEEFPQAARRMPLLFALLLNAAALYGRGVVNLSFSWLGPLLILLIGFIMCLNKIKLAWLPLALSLQVTFLLETALKIVPFYEDQLSARAFGPTARKTCLYKDFEKISSVVFYGKGPMPLYQSHSHDLAYGLKRAEEWVLKPYQVRERCDGFFVYQNQWEIFEKEFGFYKPIQRVGKIRYYQQDKSLELNFLEKERDF